MGRVYIERLPPPLLDDILNNRCLPMIGAGFSKNAILSRGKTMPVWGELGQQIADRLHAYEYDDDPIEAISAYDHEYGQARFDLARYARLPANDSLQRLTKECPVTDSKPYFANNEAMQSSETGTWVNWSGLDTLDFMPGLHFQPVLGDKLMVNFIRFEPNSEAALHWHDEEQIAFVLEGEFEFTVAGETRTMRRGDAVVIPPNVPHAARTYDNECLQVDVFHPPRRGILDAMGK